MNIATQTIDSFCTFVLDLSFAYEAVLSDRLSWVYLCLATASSALVG